jgi:hypothetical protein
MFLTDSLLLEILFSMLSSRFFVFSYFSSKISFYIATQTEDSWRYAGLYQFYSLPIAWHDENNNGNGFDIIH